MLSTINQLPRSASAYDNIITSCDDEFDDFPTSSSFFERIDEEENDENMENNNNRITRKHEKIMIFEINIPRDYNQPNGMAFRLVGTRSRGIFIAYVHATSPQNAQLREGDRIMKCNQVNLQTVSVDQAANILRFWMNRTDVLNLQIERRPNGEKEMKKRRKQTRISMCIDQQEQNRELYTYSGLATIKMTSSKSAEVLRFGEETSSFRMKSPRYVSFDGSTSSSLSQHSYKTTICPQCNTPTKLLYLHQFSHGIFNNAFRFLTFSRSSYSLL